MIKIIRPDAPDFLRQNWKQWGHESRNNVEAGKDFPKHQLHKIRHFLGEMTQYHCAFCDAAPLGGDGTRNTIEHFRPKSKYPFLTYYWQNLFPCCDACQNKNNIFDKILLKPDEIGYSFDYYFDFQIDSGEIIANEIRSKEEQNRANRTIEVYPLNTPPERCVARKNEWRRFRNSLFAESEEDRMLLDELKYRFFFYKLTPEEQRAIQTHYLDSSNEKTQGSFFAEMLRDQCLNNVQFSR